MKLTSPIIFLSVYVGASLASVPIWGQCGGSNYGGDTTCDSGLTCVFFNQWYSQCQHGSDSTTSTTSTTPTSTTTQSTSTTSVPNPTVTGFVSVSGQQFTLNGSKYTVVGANSYWVGLGGYGESDINKAFVTGRANLSAL